jgi:tetratricopeptide (TPR) repeat protein
MNSKLSRFCDAIIEAGWLTALIVTPLFFNVHSSRVFEPDKLGLLRSIALLMAVAWLSKVANEGLAAARDAVRGGGPSGQPTLWQRIRNTPLVLPTLILVVSYLISTLLSVSPRISWWGSYQRLQGTLSMLSYLVIFFLVLGHLRRREQWQRMVFAMILTSLPISIYGVIQRTGLDPLPWGGNVRTRVASNMGNSIFVAAYLLMVIFLTLQRTLVHFGRLLRDQGSRTGLVDAILAGCYLFILAVQGLTFLFTQSRGPFLGLLAGLYVFSLVGLLGLRSWAAANERLGRGLRTVLRWGWAAAVVGAVAVILFLVVFNLPSSPLAGLRDSALIGRLGTALDLESNTARVRTLIWEGTVELVGSHPALEYPTTGGQGDVTATRPDPFAILRVPFGYGPETMWVTFNRFYPPDLAYHESRNASPDRSHNETFDSLAITGIFGFVAYMAVFISLFYFSLKWLGLIRGDRQRLAFLALSLGGGLLGAVLSYLFQGSWILLGLGLPTGLILGTILYITGAAIWNERRDLPMVLDQRSVLLITVLATIVAHFVEIHFGIAIAATRTYFWVWSAVLVVTGLGLLQLGSGPEVKVAGQAPPPAPVSARSSASAKGKRGPAAASRRVPDTALAAVHHDRGWNEVMILAVIAGLILFTLAYDFVINPSSAALRSSNPVAVFWNALTSRVQAGERVTSLGILWMVVFSWLLGMAIALFNLARDLPERIRGGWFGLASLLYSSISLGVFLVGGLIHAIGIARGAALQTTTGGLTLEEQLDRLIAVTTGHFTWYVVALLVLGLALALLIWRNRPGEGSWLGAGGWLAMAAAVVFFTLALVFIARVNLNLVQADIIYKIGQAYDSARIYDGAVYLYGKAVERQPREDYYYLFLGRSQLELARETTGAERARYLQDAEQSLLTAQALNPLNTDHSANLARLYLTESQMVDAAQSGPLLQRALDYYKVATMLSPNAAHLYNETSTTYLTGGDTADALQQLQLSLELDQRYSDTYRRLGDLYRTTGELEQAINAYNQALALKPNDWEVHSALGYLYAQQGDLARAIDENLAVVELRPNDLSAHGNLAVLYDEAGDPASALAHAQQALQLAQNDDDRASLEAHIQELQQQLGAP